MKHEDVNRLYDEGYADTYEARYLESAATSPDALHELKLIGGLLGAGDRWLDVACGTGYFLNRFPDASRAGIDISPAMLERARAVNPNIEFRHHDYRQPIPEWVDSFDLVSCMWYAYGYVDSMDELTRLIANLAAWTSLTGRCFVPLGDPRAISRTDLPYALGLPVYGGKITITGILWTFVEGDESKVHRHLLAPQTEYMIEQFEAFFEHVEILHYPPTAPGVSPRTALLAGGKRPARDA